MDENLNPQNYDLAYIDYCKGMKYKEIAEKYGVTINTVKSWKTDTNGQKTGKRCAHKIRKRCAHKMTIKKKRQRSS